VGRLMAWRDFNAALRRHWQINPVASDLNTAENVQTSCCNQALTLKTGIR
jgi:hypothetical protein